jgi:hypothetical protein
MKTPTHRNLLIALGVAVAVVILFTAIYFKDGALTFGRVQQHQNQVVPKKTSEAVVNRISKKVLPLFHYLKKTVSL